MLSPLTFIKVFPLWEALSDITVWLRATQTKWAWLQFGHTESIWVSNVVPLSYMATNVLITTAQRTPKTHQITSNRRYCGCYEFLCQMAVFVCVSVSWIILLMPNFHSEWTWISGKVNLCVWVMEFEHMRNMCVKECLAKPWRNMADIVFASRTRAPAPLISYWWAYKCAEPMVCSPRPFYHASKVLLTSQ